ncbi:MAG: shikimate dehydrogenase, partial [Chloroflexota bacterium]|nr:shikimate dehydrogenase [Chloroflexota bacterium]
LRAPDVLGANVTVPHKLAVMAYLDEVTPLAQQAGAVNTIVHRGGHLFGDNTDVPGFVAGLLETGLDMANRAALILGAGGAARAVVLALSEMGLEQITIANRTPERAQALRDALAPLSLRLIPSDPQALAAALPQITLLVNATAAGWHPGEAPLPLALLDLLPGDGLVVDLTYRDTDLLVAARERRLATLDGLPMLIHQGARALELWTGRRAPVAVMREAALAARAART